MPPGAAAAALSLDAARLRDLADQPNTTVLTETHEQVRPAWSVAAVRPLLERLVARVLAFDDETSDFAVRKACLDDPEVLRFYRDHPNFYSVLTDRAKVRDPKLRAAVTGMLHVQGRVEAGEVAAGREADTLATQTVLAATGSVPPPR